MRRRVWAAVGALALIVSGCSQGGPEEASVEQVTRGPSPQEAYVTWVRDNVPEAREAQEETLLEFGQAICDALDAGVPLSAIANEVGRVATEEEARVLGQLSAGAVIDLCPDVMKED